IMKSQRPGVGPSGDFRGRFVQRDFFSMFGLQFLHGGPWGKAIDLEPERQIVISRALNEWVFGGGNNVDKTLQIGEDPSPFTVVGIVDNWHPQPAYYDLTTGSFPRKGPEVFLPYALNPVLEEFPMGNISGWQNAILQSYQDLLKSEFVWQVFWVQLNNDDEVARYRAYLKAYVQQQRQLGRFANPNPRGELRNVSEWLDYNQVISRDNQVMVGLSFLFLLVCLVNTIGLLLAKFLRKM
ncbi:MAG: ABC transporter permease, partial [Cellvibrionaceae bacterium]|nr:ABC transporter permease [Cellvibrionaceae bacterium]